MRADDWIIDFLVNKGVTDVFGIPGAVILDFLYAVNRRVPEIKPHLTYHEQGGAFAACGYAQSSGKLGVAYGTRGPGFTNMVTAIADAYYDSVPTMFFTAHSTLGLSHEMRVLNNQEIDTVSFVKNVTKYACRVDDLVQLHKAVEEAYDAATTGRKGPVFLDIYSGLFSKEIDVEENALEKKDESDISYLKNAFVKELNQAKRPILLIGNGARECKEPISKLAEKYHLPILSSRAGQDIIPDSDLYFGFVGSRATRYSNFILSKSDLIIAIGNRMAFPTKSKSFRPVVENAHIIHIDIDNAEFGRDIPNCINFNLDSETALKALINTDCVDRDRSDWINVCRILREKLEHWDENREIQLIGNILTSVESDVPITCDVGNNSFWVSTAYSYYGAKNRIMYSGSFGTLGSAFPKAIGAHYSSRKPALCFTGDQGFQFNIQELQTVSENHLPVTVVILNNSSSGMIKERETAKFGNNYVHTTLDSGYGFPNFEKVADGYGIRYTRVGLDQNELPDIDFSVANVIEIMIDAEEELYPTLPIGRKCEDLYPDLPRELYTELDNL